ncbi:MAG: Asp-tRNA(Asn)/Glu-tRNA(Gln) amidotransferase subunit GatB [Candidatus Promineifilaceae bacterium]
MARRSLPDSARYEPFIGLEVHAELLTASKMFCGCPVVAGVAAAPNTAVCPVCLGLPGSLPAVNRRAVEFALRVALALQAEVQPHNVFARKNYFYPDLPKGYQISQYALPLATGGWLDLQSESGPRRVALQRVHMEEDTGKLTHLEAGRGSLVDFNRAGVPLLEIVSEPDLHSAEEARAYGLQLRQILRYLEVNSGDMEKGVIRFEANVSLRPAGAQALGTRTEIKNLNSFRALADAINYELARQAAVLDAGGRVEQDTLGWDEARAATYSQRDKEEAHDYRYFPEPDLPPLQLDPARIEAIGRELPELPAARAGRYRRELGLSAYEAGVLTEDRPVADWFEAALRAGGEPEAVSNWLTNTLFGLLSETGRSLPDVLLTPAGLVGLLRLVDASQINQTSAKEVLAEMLATGRAAEAIVAERSLGQISDEDQLAARVTQVLADNPEQLTAYRAGKASLRGWFVGQVMRALGGRANPAVVNRLLDEALAEGSPGASEPGGDQRPPGG